MKNLRIVSINTTHSCEAKELRYRTDAEWICAIRDCCDWDRPIYVTPHPDDSYIRRHFVAQTLDADGYIIPGDYETETPELGKVMYSIWTEKSDYYKSLFPPTKPTFWQRNKRRDKDDRMGRAYSVNMLYRQQYPQTLRY